MSNIIDMMSQTSQSCTLLCFYTYIITTYLFDKYVEKRMDKFYREAFYAQLMNSENRAQDFFTLTVKEQYALIKK